MFLIVTMLVKELFYITALFILIFINASMLLSTVKIILMLSIYILNCYYAKQFHSSPFLLISFSFIFFNILCYCNDSTANILPIFGYLRKLSVS